MKKKIFIFLVLGLVTSVGCRSQRETSPSEATLYTCTMHPEIIRDKPGVCPICGMTLVPLPQQEPGPEHQHQHKEGAMMLSPERRQIIGVTTEKLVRKPLQRELRLPGRVAYDQELYVTEQEYVSGFKFGVASEFRHLIENKLRRLGTSEEELKQLQKTHEADSALFLPKEGKGIWIYANVYEQELTWVSKGMGATMALPSNAAITFEGEVKAITPTLDPLTRTATARIWVGHPPVELKPETYVNVVLKQNLGSQLSVPSEAVVDTGTRQIVFVDLGEGMIEPREVKLGTLAGNDYPVAEGLSEGETVITSAHFLIDSEAQIQAAIKKFGAPAAGGHHH